MAVPDRRRAMFGDRVEHALVNRTSPAVRGARCLPHGYRNYDRRFLCPAAFFVPHSQFSKSTIASSRWIDFVAKVS